VDGEGDPVAEATHQTFSWLLSVRTLGVLHYRLVCPTARHCHIYDAENATTARERRSAALLATAILWPTVCLARTLLRQRP
jgi:hypothetical protein